MTTLVTGGSGFIGAHVVRELRAQGEQARVLDLTPPDDDTPHVIGSVTDETAVAAAMGGVKSVIHLAANAHLWARRRSDFETVNHQGSRLVLKVARDYGVKRFVHGSSLTVYIGGARRLIPVTVGADDYLSEAAMLGAYPRSKWRAERAALAACTPDFHVICVAPTMPVGPGDKGLTGPTKMILNFVNGSVPAYLETLFDLIDVRDLARAIIAARDVGRPGARYILGGGPLWMSELLQLLAETTGLTMPKRRVPFGLAYAAAATEEWIADRITRRPPTAPLTGLKIAGRPTKFDVRAAEDELGLTRRPLETSVRDAVAWMQQEGLLKRSPTAPYFVGDVE